MNADKLLKTLPVLQGQLDGLLEFDCQANDLSNGMIFLAFQCFVINLISIIHHLIFPTPVFLHTRDRCHQYELYAALPRLNTFVCVLQ